MGQEAKGQENMHQKTQGAQHTLYTLSRSKNYHKETGKKTRDKVVKAMEPKLSANNISRIITRIDASSFDVANSASSYANGAFSAANTADQRAVTSGTYLLSTLFLA